MTIYTTGIGSLPFDDADRAVEHVFAHYTLPFLPQLPKRLAVGNMASMFMEALTPEMLGALREKDARAFGAALQVAAKAGDKATAAVAHWPGATPAFKAAAAKAPRLKLQLIGPASFIALAEMQLGPGTVATIAACDWLRALQRTALHVLAPATSEVFWIWDDAILALPKAATIRATWLSSAPSHPRVTEGYHCCAPIPFATLTKALPAKLFAVDLNVVQFEPAELQSFASAGGRLIAGVVDTRDNKVDQAALFRLTAELPRGSVLAYSGGCGTGLHEPQFEAALAKALRTLA
jgi:hypothetical protein